MAAESKQNQTDQGRLLAAIKAHVPFDGWSDPSFRAAIADCEMDAQVARAACPRGALDLALAFHAEGDAAMVARLKSADLSAMRFRDRVAFGVRARLEAVDDKELVRRGTTLFALPMHAADGARALWGTADKIWDTLGDKAQDYNWYTKRATLSGVYGATVLYWLGDDSPGHQRTWNFLDRRIDDVMQIEKLKGDARKMPVVGTFVTGAEKLLSGIRPPMRVPDVPLPGQWRRPE